MIKQKAEQYRQPELILMSTPEIQIAHLQAAPLHKAAAAWSRESFARGIMDTSQLISSRWVIQWTGSTQAPGASGDELMQIMLLPFPQAWAFVLTSLFLFGMQLERTLWTIWPWLDLVQIATENKAHNPCFVWFSFTLKAENRAERPGVRYLNTLDSPSLEHLLCQAPSSIIFWDLFLG